MKYKLKEDFAGKKAGEILELFPSQARLGLYYTYFTYKKVNISLDSNMTELLEEVKDEPLFYTNEDEVYLDGKKIGINKDDTFYYIPRYSQGIGTMIAGANQYDAKKALGRFATKQAAEDYIKLQQAINDSGLKIGDIFPADKETVYKSSSWIENKWSDWPSQYEINGFCIKENKCCAYYITKLEDGAVFFFELKNKPKLLFGDKEVTLEIYISKLHDEDFIPDELSVKIKCNGEVCTYSEAKKFRDAITTIKNFKFGDKSLLLEGFSPKHNFEFLKIGCTTGTLKQIDTILLECEKLLKL